MLGACGHYVGSFFALECLFIVLGRLLRVCSAFFWTLGRSGLDFGWSGAGCGTFRTTVVDNFSR